jgi:hypothetical protein
LTNWARICNFFTKGPLCIDGYNEGTHCSYVQAKGGPLPSWLNITLTVNQVLEIQREYCR